MTGAAWGEWPGGFLNVHVGGLLSGCHCTSLCVPEAMLLHRHLVEALLGTGCSPESRG